MDETLYHTIADATLMHCYDQLDDAFECGAIDDIELQNGILSILTASGVTLIVSKHTPSRQIWLASPVLGGLHFSYDVGAQHWALPDTRALYDVLRSELATHNVTVVL